MVFGSLFSGAGLLDAGLHQAGVRHGWFVERDEFRRGLLARRWPGVPVHDDVRTAGAHNLAPVDGIVGGFPCKGASNAGLRTGLAHPETALWSEFERIVRELRPRYVLVENVAAILTLHGGAVWGTVLGDLASLGYDVAWDCIPASAVGAPHGRDRVFAVARHPAVPRLEGFGLRGPVAEHVGAVAHAQDGGRAAAADAGEPGGLGRHAGATAGAAADTDGSRWPARWQPERAECERVGDIADEDAPEAAADARSGSAQLRRGPGAVRGSTRAAEGEGHQRQRGGDTTAERTEADANAAWRAQGVEWGDYEPAVRRWEAIHGPAPEPLLRRMDDGDAKLRRMRSRVDRSRLSALGDGVHVYVGRLLGEALMALDSKEAA